VRLQCTDQSGFRYNARIVQVRCGLAVNGICRKHHGHVCVRQRALASFKAAKDIAEAMIGLRDAQAFQAKLLEFQSNLIDANNAVFAAQDERTALLVRWSAYVILKGDCTGSMEAEKQRYMRSLRQPIATLVPRERGVSAL
jgi:hypothetical protein